MNFLRNYLLSNGTKLSPCVSRQLQCPTVTTGHNLLNTHSMSSQYKPEQVLHDATKQEFYLEIGGERWGLVNLIFNLGCGACNCDVITNRMLKFLMFNIITTMGWDWVIQRSSYLSQAVRSLRSKKDTLNWSSNPLGWLPRFYHTHVDFGIKYQNCLDFCEASRRNHFIRYDCLRQASADMLTQFYT